MGLARAARAAFYANHGNLCVGIVQVDGCESSKEFIDLHIVDRALKRRNWVVKYVKMLEREDWLGKV